MIDENPSWRNGSSKVGKKEVTKIDTQDFGNSLRNTFVALRRKKNSRLLKAWFLASERVVKVEVEKTISGSLSRGFSD